ncbi:NAD(P)-dependent oxidoreductase [Fibrella aquatilis]|uniref:SDR family oxidoreductase n=1 Tax=Fibrella aquatilis TaxID=2817059 RepID=A0A939G8X7_9BACT|nr:SDR family oxidoreductase [Fibrella aquatilis]MBO0931983.1 SDR family oxidoreductase [Fibrella aquatilis]
MHVFIFGATGPTGQLVLSNLLQAGHQVTALARNPAKLVAPDSPRFQRLQGDVMDPLTYQEQLRGIDVVVSLLGTGSSTKPTRIYSAGGQAIVQAMRQADVKKLITITSGGVQEDDPTIQRSFFYKYVGLWWLRHIYADMKRWEALLSQSIDVDWICVRPTYLVNGPLTGVYRVRETYSPEGGWKISRTDLADFITKQIASSQYIHKKPVIGY